MILTKEQTAQKPRKIQQIMYKLQLSEQWTVRSNRCKTSLFGRRVGQRRMSVLRCSHQSTS